ncbi:MAG: FAD-dependent oxidoreductase [Actinomycetota bacterium]
MRTDVVVVGGGLLGLSTAYGLRDRREVVVLERETVGHSRSGSHGLSRVFRLGYADPLYVRLAGLALDRWRALESDTGVALLEVTGQLSFGAGAQPVLDAMSAVGAPVASLSAAEVAERFPALRGHGAAVFEPESGVIAAAETLAALRATAAFSVREHTRVLAVGDGHVDTEDGAITADVVVVCAGPWTRQLVDVGVGNATLEHVAYLRPHDVTAPRPPIFIAHDEPVVYGLPTPRSSLYKIALHRAGTAVDPETMSADPDPVLVRALEQAARAWLPDFDPTAFEIDVCPYDNTPDEDFVLFRDGNVVVGAGTSGHGFKFGPLLGELLAELVMGTEPSVPLARFAPRR